MRAALLRRTSALLAPRERMLPGLGARLAGRPRLVAAILVALRRLPSARLRRLAARNISRPLLRRMNARLEVPVVGGSRMLVDTSDPLGRLLAISGTWEASTTAAFCSLLREGDVCVDAGANIGYYTLLASRIVGETGRVYALEPEADVFETLRANLALNGVSNVRAECVAAGAEDGEALLHASPPGTRSWASIRSLPWARPTPDAPSLPSTAVTVRRIADLVEPRDRPRLRLVKIDVEGYELEVLRGLAPLLEAGHRHALIVELTPELWLEDGAAFLSGFCLSHALRAFELLEDDRPGAQPTDWRDVPFAFDSLPSDRREVVLIPAESVPSL